LKSLLEAQTSAELIFPALLQLQAFWQEERTCQASVVLVEELVLLVSSLVETVVPQIDP
jgi:hypothetical protein